MAPAKPLRSAEPIAIDARAADNIRYIREAMERAGEFTAVPGWGAMFIGASALATAAVAARQTSPQRWLMIWLAEAALAITIAAAAAARKSHRARMPLFSGPGRKFALSFAPPIVVGALLTAVLFRAGLVSALPGMWLLLYGTAVVTGGAFSVRVVPLMGLCFMALGVAALFAPAQWSDMFMAGGFGCLQMIFGIIIAKRYGG
jgi:hypothetical protein